MNTASIKRFVFRRGDRREREDELQQWRSIARKVRLFAAWRYIRGSGIEIGALNVPLPTFHGARVRYVDRVSTQELSGIYAELAGRELVTVDMVADGEKLDPIANESCDFVIANHMIEHARNPIEAIENMLRVLKPDGILYCAIPDKRFTFDAERPITPFDHLRRDYEEGPEWSDRDHYLEWTTKVEKIADPKAIEKRASQLRARRANIHFHVWTQREIIELFFRLRAEFSFPLEIETATKNSQELVVVLRKADLG